jgi:hypothetical protein
MAVAAARRPWTLARCLAIILRKNHLASLLDSANGLSPSLLDCPIPAVRPMPMPLGANLPDAERLEVVAATRRWLEKAVIGLDLCPFAKAVHRERRIRYVASGATAPVELLAALLDELELLTAADPGEIETTLLIHPLALADFLEFNDFLAVAEAAVEDLGLAAIIQVASFHPRYQFAGAGPDDVENYTNRSPYPILHLLRQASVDRAVASIPDPATIFEKNMATLRRLGEQGWRRLGIEPAPISSRRP